MANAQEDGLSSASDDDRNAVEVRPTYLSPDTPASPVKLTHSFPFSQVSFIESNPYRRKSSLVKDDVPPHLRKTECLVHQFLEGQKTPSMQQQHHHYQDGASQHSHRPHHNHEHHEYETHTALHLLGGAKEPGVNRPQDPKGVKARRPSDTLSRTGSSGNSVRARPRCSVMSDPDGSDVSDAGQVDELEWRDGMTTVGVTAAQRKNTSESDGHGEATHSRLLTKKQLSEMAWGVRELSRRLGTIRLRFRVRNIFLLVKIYDADVMVNARELVAWLLDEGARATTYTVYVEEGLKASRAFDLDRLVGEVAARQAGAKSPSEAEGLEEGRKREVAKRVKVWDERMCRARPQTFDFVITLGGDGTVLYASWLFQRIVPPVLSFALGSLGFLTKFDFGDYQKTLDGAFNQGVSVSLRLRFEGTVMRSCHRRVIPVMGPDAADSDDVEVQRNRDLINELIGEEKDDERTHRPNGTYEVLNEVVVDRGPNASK